MKFVSTRGGVTPLFFSEAVVQGLAEDGGLFVPERFPHFALSDFEDRATAPEVGSALITPFLEGDPLARVVDGLAAAAFDFPFPLRRIDATTDVLELFHGPTAAFKDVGARFLAECMTRIGGGKRTVLVATSGDTGGAVAAAFHGKPGIEVVVLFPEDGVSEEQRMQLTTWDGNVRAFAVRGSFDDCQRLVKEAFADAALRKANGFTSANSINVGRLLPQMVYYAKAALESWRRDREAPGFIVPAGNLGNALACFWAWKSGLPIRHVALATNANRVIPDFFETGIFEPARTIPTMANAMDVGNPSNLERLLMLFPDRKDLLAVSSAVAVGDDEIRETILESRARFGTTFCPHTATALFARRRLPRGKWIVVATAHPGKFARLLAPLVGEIPLPPSLETLRARPQRSTRIEPRLDALSSALR